MRLSLIGPVFPYRGGMAHFTTLLVRRLIDAGNIIQVISFKKQFPSFLYPGKSDKDYSPGREKVNADYLLSPTNPLSWYKTLRVLLKFNPQEVIFTWWTTLWGPAFTFLAKRLKHHGVLITIFNHNTLPHEVYFFDKYLAKRTLNQADRFILMTEREKTRLLDLLPGAQNIDIAPLPILNVFKPTALSREEVRLQLNLPSKAPVILYFGFVRQYKGLRVLVDALKLVNDKECKAHLVIVGEFWEDKAPYLEQIQTLGLVDKVHIYDRYIPDGEVANFFSAADLFVAPYIDGHQSAALKTALDFGLPVVVTNVVTDQIIEALPERCKVVAAGNVAALADGILEQISVPKQNIQQIAELSEASWAPMLEVFAKGVK